MTVKDLIDTIDPNRDYDALIEICDKEWDNVIMTAPTCSRFWILLHDCKVKDLEAMDKNRIRIEIEVPDSCKWANE